MRSAAVVFNPLAGRHRSGALLKGVIDGLRQSGFEAAPVPTRGPGDAENRAREAATGGAEAIFALGGDGTLRECAAGTLGSNAALAFLPTGTMNVMAMELGIPGRAILAARAYSAACEIRLGVGLAGNKPFLMQVSAGVDAFLIASLRGGEKKWLGSAASVPAALRALARYDFQPFEVTTESGLHEVTLAVASNIVRYGGPFRLTPRALSDGSSLELFRFSGRGRVAAAWFGLSLLVGRHLRLRGSTIERVSWARFGMAHRVPLQIDGDVLFPLDRPSLEISLATETVRMLIPRPSGDEPVSQ